MIPWLNTQPPDSGKPADIGYFCELVRVSDSMVVWRSDRISARDIGPYEYEDDMTVPPAYLASGTDVFLRMRAEPTANMVYAVSADFRFAYDSSGTVAFQKVRSIPRSQETEAAAESALRLEGVPEGSYVVVARSGGETRSVCFSVIR